MLMTVYNGGRFLPSAVESVLASEFRDFEFVIVENCSTDGSRDWLRGVKDPRVRLIENERNLGQTGALNVGLHAAAAPFVARLDADDLDVRERMGLQAARLSADERLALVGGQTQAIDAEGIPLFRTRFPIDFESIAARMTIQNCFDHSSVMFRRDAVARVRFYPDDFAVSQDYALFSALLRAGYRMENVDRVVSQVRMHPDQVMANEGSRREMGEAVRVTAANQAWAAGRDEDAALARTLLRLWSGWDAVACAGDPEPIPALKRFFAESPSPARQRARLAMLFFGGACAGSLSVRAWLLREALARDPSIVLDPEFFKRVARAALPARTLTRVRALRPSARG